jgi:hypothetical protein
MLNYDLQAQEDPLYSNCNDPVPDECSERALVHRYEACYCFVCKYNGKEILYCFSRKQINNINDNLKEIHLNEIKRYWPDDFEYENDVEPYYNNPVTPDPVIEPEDIPVVKDGSNGIQTTEQMNQLIEDSNFLK